MLNNTLGDVDAIWTTTRICGYDCPCCCVNAQHVSRRGESIAIKCPASGHVETIGFKHNAGSAFAQAARHLQVTGRELDWAGRIRILDHLHGYRAKLDITGGDCLLDPSTLDLVREASRRLGKSHVTLTATGMGCCDPGELAAHVEEVNITIDHSLSVEAKDARPVGYSKTNIRWARECVRAGLRVRAECPLTTANCDEESIEEIYREIHAVGIQTFMLMRLFTVGRGMRQPNSVPSPSQYRTAIASARRLEKKLSGPRVTVQCALRSLEHPDASKNHCDAVSKSFGIMADGTLLASPWALDVYGSPLGEEWVLGNLASTPLSEILASGKAKAFLARCNENRNHCKICAFQNSNLALREDRIFDRTDDVAAEAGAYKVGGGTAA
jgi:MoaA/NifB/PqqE/SkfB family radical SAM enzyme